MDDRRPPLPVPIDGSIPEDRPRRFARALAAFCRRRPLRAAFVVLAVVSIVALAFPGLDLWIAGLFWVPGRGFPVEHWPAAILLRQSGMAVTRIAVVVLLLALFAAILTPLLARALPMRRILFLAATLALGPGLLVNALLKEFWGRPRPREILDFGGSLDFVAAGIPGGGCLTNCSFPSGEASSAAWLFAIVLVLPAAWRGRAAIVAGVFAVAISLNRIAFGGHFLSDVLIAWTLVAIVILWCKATILDGLSEPAIAAVGGFLGRLGDRALAPLDRSRRRDDEAAPTVWRNPPG